MKRPTTVIACFAIFSLIACLGLHAEEAPQAHVDRAQDTFFQDYCFGCHGKDGKVKGDFDLREFKDADDLKANPELLSDIMKALRDGDMPPEKAKQPKAEARTAFAIHVEQLLDESLRLHATEPRTPARRMNRFQYANAVKDLLDLKVDLFVLPERIARDLSGYFQPQTGRMPEHIEVGNRLMGKGQLIVPRLRGVSPFAQDLKAVNGFDNRADLLTISPVLMESFLELSLSIFQSSDFGPKTCGKWKDWFETPPASEPLDKAVRARLGQLLSQAFRRPVDDETLDRYAAATQQCIQEGDSFSHAMQATAGAVLASPRFLYLYDGATTGDKPEPLNDFELASRLSFFLWSSAPDDALLADAEQGRLSDPAVLAAQAERMMNDGRMKRFCDAFASQWLKMENLVACEPDRTRFPDFYQFGIVSHSKFGSVHMMLEPLLLFETVFVENRPITDFIQSDFTYRSEQLSQFIAHEKKITPPKDGQSWSEICVFTRQPVSSKREGGIITTCAVMTMTSSSIDPKPISRGKWIIETLFNDPPPPPPANVPDLAEAVADKTQAKETTLREKFALHRTRTDCASCHVKIDAFGFALENYDAVGRWRDKDDNGHVIDPSGTLFKRTKFATAEQFKDALLAEKGRFARGFAGHLLKYALGRELVPGDKPVLDRIVAASATEDLRMRQMMTQVILSEPFRVKFNPAEKLSAAQP